MLHRSTIPCDDEFERGEPSSFVLRVDDDGRVAVYVEGDDLPVVEFGVYDGDLVVDAHVVDAETRLATATRSLIVSTEIGLVATYSTFGAKHGVPVR